jgi:hypothetical protein
MELYGLKLDNISEGQLSKNLRIIDELQLNRIKALEKKFKEFTQYQNMSAVKLHSIPVH